MKGNQRVRYTPEFKMEAVRLVNSSGRPVAQIARELGVARQQLSKWVDQAESRKGKASAQVFPGNGNRTQEQAELEKLRRENAQLREDNEILKKATAFFAKHSR